MAALDWSQCPAVESVHDRVGGAWVFRSTRLPVATVIDPHLKVWFSVNGAPMGTVLADPSESDLSLMVRATDDQEGGSRYVATLFHEIPGDGELPIAIEQSDQLKNGEAWKVAREHLAGVHEASRHRPIRPLRYVPANVDLAKPLEGYDSGPFSGCRRKNASRGVLNASTGVARGSRLRRSAKIPAETARAGRSGSSA